MRASHTLSIAALCLAACAAGCGEMNPRPAADVADAVPPTPPAETNHKVKTTSGHNSASTYGKARDAAVRGVEKHDEYQQKVIEQADEVFKNK